MIYAPVTGEFNGMTDPAARSIPRRLVGWKEIARHLGVSVRAAQLWERTRGLLVHRLPGARSGVYAVTEELDRWAAGESARLRGARRRRLRERRIVRAALWIAVIVLVAAAGVGGRLWMGRRNPIAAVRFEGGAVVATDTRGVDLWRAALEPPRPEAKLDGNQSLIVLADLDGDGWKEVVSAGGFKVPDTTGQEPILREEAYLVAPSGKVLWKKWMLPKLRGAVGEEFGPGWNIDEMTVASGSGRDRVWVAVCHKLRYPGVVAELMPDGSVKDVRQLRPCQFARPSLA